MQSIIRELRGEKIDIIEFSEEITTFAEKALQPAKVSRVSITDLTDKQLEVIVDDTQLSLAIGKKGQNVRLAAKLLGWKIDIKSEEEKRQEVEQQMQALSGGPTTPIEQVTELGEGIIQKLVAAGITTVESLADMTPEQLEEIPGIGEKTLERISVAVRHYFGHFEEGEEGAAAATAEEPADEPAAQSAAADTENRDGRLIGNCDCGACRRRGQAELENAQETLEEAEMLRSAGAEELAEEPGIETDISDEADIESMTAAELAVENVPPADEAELPELEAEENEIGKTETDE